MPIYPPPPPPSVSGAPPSSGVRRETPAARPAGPRAARARRARPHGRRRRSPDRRRWRPHLRARDPGQRGSPPHLPARRRLRRLQHRHRHRRPRLHRRHHHRRHGRLLRKLRGRQGHRRLRHHRRRHRRLHRRLRLRHHLHRGRDRLHHHRHARGLGHPDLPARRRGRQRQPRRHHRRRPVERVRQDRGREHRPRRRQGALRRYRGASWTNRANWRFRPAESFTFTGTAGTASNHVGYFEGGGGSTVSPSTFTRGSTTYTVRVIAWRTSLNFFRFGITPNSGSLAGFTLRVGSATSAAFPNPNTFNFSGGTTGYNYLLTGISSNPFTSGSSYSATLSRAADALASNWHGVTLTSGRLTGLNLDNNNLTGAIPAGAVARQAVRAPASST